MEIGKQYEITYPDGSVTTAKLLDIRYGSFEFEYLPNETRKQITSHKGDGDIFHFPFQYEHMLKYKEI